MCLIIISIIIQYIFIYSRYSFTQTKMAHRLPVTFSIADQLSNLDMDEYITQRNLESRASSTSYPNSPLPPSNTIDTTTTTTTTSVSSSSDSDDSVTSTIREEYQLRTLGTHNIARLSILPIYPPHILSPTTTAMTMLSPGTSNLLLSNVPSKDTK